MGSNASHVLLDIEDAPPLCSGSLHLQQAPLTNSQQLVQKDLCCNTGRLELLGCASFGQAQAVSASHMVRVEGKG